MSTNPNEFIRFHHLLTKDHQEYQPFYFPLQPNRKDPLEGISWKKNKITVEQAVEFLNKGFNVGFAGTDKDDVVIVDIDDISKVTDYKPTLITKSRKRIGLHCYYFTKDEITDNIFVDSAKQNIATEKYGEVRSNWQYVVAPGSFVHTSEEEIDDDGNRLWDRIPDEEKINAGKYTVFHESNVADITFSELPAVFRELIEEKRTLEVKKMVEDKEDLQPVRGDSIKSALYSLKIEDVVGKSVRGGSERFPSLFHGSKTGMNTSLKDGLLHCWRHNVSHSALTALAVRMGIMDCSSAGYPHGHGHSSLDLKDGQTIFSLWEYAKKEGLISTNDPIPTRALVWYALENKLCEPNEIRDNWKLPKKAYNEAINRLNKSDIPSGRCELKTEIDVFKYNDDDEIIGVSRPKVLEAVLNDQKYITLTDSREIYHYEGGVYKPNGAPVLEKKIHSLVDDAFYTIQLKNECTNLLSVKTFIGRDRINAVTNYLNLKNGIYDLNTDKLLPHTPDVPCTIQLPVEYIHTADCPKFKKYLSEVVYPEDVPVVQETLGYCLYPVMLFHKAVMLYGSGGGGKGVLMFVAQKLLGDDNCSNLSLQAIEEQQFALVQLYGKLANICGDLSPRALKGTGVFKQLTGGDMIEAELKFSNNRLRFRNRAKLIFSANQIPRSLDDSDAFFQRWIIIVFPYVFRDTERDVKTLREDIVREELSGIFNFALEGLKRLLKNNKFSNSKGSAEVKEQYLRLSDPLHVFFSDCVIEGREDYVVKDTLYERYREYCQRQKLAPVVMKEVFSKRINSYVKVEPIRPEVDGKRVTAWYGISLKDCNTCQKNDTCRTQGSTRQGSVRVGCPTLTEASASGFLGTENSEKSTSGELRQGCQGKILPNACEGKEECKEIKKEVCNIEQELQNTPDIPDGSPGIANSENSSFQKTSMPESPSGFVASVQATPDTVTGREDNATPVIQAVHEEMREWKKTHGVINSTNSAAFVMGYFMPRHPEFKADEVNQTVKKLAHITPGEGDTNSERSKEHKYFLIKTKCAVPKFVGTDEITYELKAGDEVNIPEVNAKALIKRGAAEQIHVISNPKEEYHP